MKIISGGQTGADLGGLVAAKLHNLDTGGWMPKGFKTQAGPRPEYAKFFNLREHVSDSYKQRTYSNVADADITIRIAVDFKSPGEKCTLNAIKAYGKPHYDVKIKEHQPVILHNHVEDLLTWFCEESRNIKIVNIAGNSHKTWAGMQFYTQTFLSLFFFRMGYHRLIFPKEYK